MHTNHSRPNWWILYLLAGLFLLAFFLEVSKPFTHTGHVYAEIDLVLLLYGTASWWLQANAASLIREEHQKSARYYRKMTPETNRPSAQVDEPDVRPAAGRKLPRSLFRYAGWSIPAWLYSIASYLAAKIHQWL